MIKSELIATVAEANHLTRANTERVVNTFFDAITDALVKGKRVELRGWGVLSVRTRKSRTGRNPRTGASVQVAEKRVPFFKAGKAIKDALNKKG